MLGEKLLGMFGPQLSVGFEMTEQKKQKSGITVLLRVVQSLQQYCMLTH